MRVFLFALGLLLAAEPNNQADASRLGVDVSLVEALRAIYRGPLFDEPDPVLLDREYVSTSVAASWGSGACEGLIIERGVSSPDGDGSAVSRIAVGRRLGKVKGVLGLSSDASDMYGESRLTQVSVVDGGVVSLHTNIDFGPEWVPGQTGPSQAEFRKRQESFAWVISGRACVPTLIEANGTWDDARHHERLRVTSRMLSSADAGPALVVEYRNPRGRWQELNVRDIRAADRTVDVAFGNDELWSLRFEERGLVATGPDGGTQRFGKITDGP